MEHQSMTDPTNRPPLWQLMADAFLLSVNTGHSEEMAMAAELRAIADWLVPEEPIVVEGGRTYEQAWLVSERERLRLLLLGEADRAEAGGRYWQRTAVNRQPFIGGL